MSGGGDVKGGRGVYKSERNGLCPLFFLSSSVPLFLDSLSLAFYGLLSLVVYGSVCLYLELCYILLSVLASPAIWQTLVVRSVR